MIYLEEMFGFTKEKVYPTLQDLEDSSSDEDISKVYSDSVAGSISTPEVKGQWNDLVQDFEMRIEDSLGKCSLYMIEGTPLRKNVGTTGLHMITGEIMQTYGLEFLNHVNEVIEETIVDRKLPLEKILCEMKTLDFKKYSGKKLIIWIDDDETGESNNDPDFSFGRLFITELLNWAIEPDLMIPCNDLDEEVLLALLKILNKNASLVDFQGAGMQAFFEIGLSLALASRNCNLLVMDTNRIFSDAPANHNFVKFAQELGHQVIYLRNNPEIRSKDLAVENIVKKIKEWKKEQINPTVSQPQPENTPSTSKGLHELYRPASDSGVTPNYIEMAKALKKGDIINKLTRNHFVKPIVEDCSSTDSEDFNDIDI